MIDYFATATRVTANCLTPPTLHLRLLAKEIARSRPAVKEALSVAFSDHLATTAC